MNSLFWLAILIFFILMPPIVFLVIFLYISTKFKFKFKVSGPFKYRDIMLEYVNENFSFVLRIDLIHFYFIWMKLRILLKGVYVNFTLNSKILKIKPSIFQHNHKHLNEKEKRRNKHKEKSEYNSESKF